MTPALAALLEARRQGNGPGSLLWRQLAQPLALCLADRGNPKSAEALGRALVEAGVNPDDIFKSVEVLPPGQNGSGNQVPNFPALKEGKLGTSLNPVRLADFEPLPPEPGYFGGRLPKGFPSLTYGDGGHGKSYLALGAAVGAASGKGLLDMNLPQGAALYVDWELDQTEQTRRAYRVARGIGLDKPPADLLYLAADRSVLRLLEPLRAAIQTYGVRLLILDSFGMAAGVDPEKAEAVIRVLGDLRTLGVTTLLLDHQSKMQEGQDYTKKTPFGSAFKYNLCRSVLHLERVEGMKDAAKLLLVQRKNNFGPQADDLGMTLRFTDEAVLFESVALDQDAAFEHRRDAGDRILAALAEGPATVAKLGDSAGLPAKTVRNTLPRLRRGGKAEEAGKDGKAVLWRLCNCPTAQGYRAGQLGSSLESYEPGADAPQVQKVLDSFPGSKVKDSGKGTV